MARGCVLACSHDANENDMSRAIQIQSWIPEHIKLSLLEARLQSKPPTQLLFYTQSDAEEYEY